MLSKWDKRYLDLAEHISQWSKDPSKKIGAIAVGDHGQILSQGYNGFPRGIDDSAHRYNHREVKYQFVVHAEMNCIYNATLTGVSLKDSTFYIYGLPVCHECAKGLVQVGIKRVVTRVQDFVEQWETSELTTKTIFKESGIIYDRV